MASVTYPAGAELPDLGLRWPPFGPLIDFSSGYTFTVKVGQPGQTASFTKTTGVTGAATNPNVTIAWATAAELSTLAVGNYTIQVAARKTADSKDLFYPGGISLNITPAIT